MDLSKHFDVIVVGGGHAGTEAALAAARMGMATLLLTQNLETLGQMSCNPAIGGIGKGHLVKEVDALGGLMAKATDMAGIQFRILNARKGPAVQATRAQADRVLYRQAVKQALENQPGLSLFQQGVLDFIVEGDTIKGVVTQMGVKFFAPTVILTVGTFLAGKIHIGLSNYAGGRAGDPAADALAQRLRALPFRVGRLKTGTPPRVNGHSIDYRKLTVQWGDQPTPVFSYHGHGDQHPRQVACHITATNEKTHKIIRAGLDRSPLYSGVINSVGPRYCPSIEDKIMRFADKTAHQIFVEPEGLHTNEVYPNGISTSLPFDVQCEMVRSIDGFENAHITRPGYAIEYDYFDPRDLKLSLETHFIQGLFFAGQINGTTGYEEAAAQGLIAGINAARMVQAKEAWTPSRDQAYIGVLIDDLVTRGTSEPYRMFTSRAEYRLLLREDNADLRLTPMGRELGLIDEQRWRSFSDKKEAIEKEWQRLENTTVQASSLTDQQMSQVFGQALTREYRASELLRRPEVSYQSLMSLPTLGPAVEDSTVAEQLNIKAKYAGYIKRQQTEIARHHRHNETGLPTDIDYADVVGLSNEVRQKLSLTRPQTIGQAARIPGMTPAAVSLLLVHLKRLTGKKAREKSKEIQ